MSAYKKEPPEGGSFLYGLEVKRYAYLFTGYSLLARHLA